MTTKKSDTTKLTKHTFLDKIKNTAATIDSNKIKSMDKKKNDADSKEKSAGKWDALKDDFMMNPKKVRFVPDDGHDTLLIQWYGSFLCYDFLTHTTRIGTKNHPKKNRIMSLKSQVNHWKTKKLRSPKRTKGENLAPETKDFQKEVVKEMYRVVSFRW